VIGVTCPRLGVDHLTPDRVEVIAVPQDAPGRIAKPILKSVERIIHDFLVDQEKVIVCLVVIIVRISDAANLDDCCRTCGIQSLGKDVHDRILFKDIFDFHISSYRFVLSHGHLRPFSQKARPRQAGNDFSLRDLSFWIFRRISPAPTACCQWNRQGKHQCLMS
jgi:hypothetical protein